MMNLFKSLAEGMNYEEIARKNYQPGVFSRDIVSLHFCHNLVLLHKGSNDEGSDLAAEHVY